MGLLRPAAPLGGHAPAAAPPARLPGGAPRPDRRRRLCRRGARRGGRRCRRPPAARAAPRRSRRPAAPPRPPAAPRRCGRGRAACAAARVRPPAHAAPARPTRPCSRLTVKATHPERGGVIHTSVARRHRSDIPKPCTRAPRNRATSVDRPARRLLTCTCNPRRRQRRKQRRVGRRRRQPRAWHRPALHQPQVVAPRAPARHGARRRQPAPRHYPSSTFCVLQRLKLAARRARSAGSPPPTADQLGSVCVSLISAWRGARRRAWQRWALMRQRRGRPFSILLTNLCAGHSLLLASRAWGMDGHTRGGVGA